MVKELPSHGLLWLEWQSQGLQVSAPTLIFYEVPNVLHRLTIAKQISESKCDEFLQTAFSLSVACYPQLELHHQALALARQFNLPATYDAHYLALAIFLDCQLWTGQFG